ncbi:UvrD-helicase domain-containing protein, partial [Treponema endosymbiont of Eucomonympha sp.]|uniref:UvrD-helicase domain-containing protein n=1 Tax=Treponema endosymbiont of Eucomonympha sp. TaxID=1580831 RepID=UPI000B083A27
PGEDGSRDFGDLIRLPVARLAEKYAVRDRLRRQFRAVMVDEYQDANVAQFKLRRQLAGDETYVCAVGDDDQSIYRFRGAEVRNILSFQEQFAGTELIRLEENYRSFAPILEVANSVVSKNRDRLGKTLRARRKGGEKPALYYLGDQDEEARLCADLIARAHKSGSPYADWAVLYRTNAQSRGFESEFLLRSLPYAVVGSLK